MAILAVLAVLVINGIVRHSAMPYIINAEDVDDDYDCILILGCGVVGKTPSPMLEDRLLVGIDVFESEKCDVLLMSGDHGREEYDEVNCIKDFAISKALMPSSNSLTLSLKVTLIIFILLKNKKTPSTKGRSIISPRFHPNSENFSALKNL